MQFSAKSLEKLKQTKKVSFKISANASSLTEAYSETCLRSKMERFAKTVKAHQTLHLRCLTGFWICLWTIPLNTCIPLYFWICLWVPSSPIIPQVCCRFVVSSILIFYCSLGASLSFNFTLLISFLSLSPLTYLHGMN